MPAQTHLGVRGEHKCDIYCTDEMAPESTNNNVRYLSLDNAAARPAHSNLPRAPPKTSRSPGQKKPSTSVAPKMTDINRQSENLLPQIQITNKKLTQAVGYAASSRREKLRQFVLKPQIDSSADHRKILENDTNTEGVDTDGGSVGHARVLRSTESGASLGSGHSRNMLIHRDGTLSLGQKQRIFEQLQSSAK